MSELFIVFLSLSLSGSVFGLILLALKPIVKNRISFSWQYYIWLLVILRLLFPFAPETSLIGTLFMFIQAEDRLVLPFPANDIFTYVWLLWLVVALAVFTHKIIGYRSLLRFIRMGNVKVTDKNVLDTYEGLLAATKIRPKLCINEQVSSPMMIGVFRPALVIPGLPADTEAFGNIVRHELTHHKRLDFLYKWLVQIVLCLHWFNPFIYFISKEINRSCELSCDETVIRELDDAGRFAYGDALMSVLNTQKTRGAYSNFVVSVTMNENAGFLKERLGFIAGYKKKSRSALFAAALLTVLLLWVSVYTGAYVMAEKDTEQEVRKAENITEPETDDDSPVPAPKEPLVTAEVIQEEETAPEAETETSVMIEETPVMAAEMTVPTEEAPVVAEMTVPTEEAPVTAEEIPVMAEEIPIPVSEIVLSNPERDFFYHCIENRLEEAMALYAAGVDTGYRQSNGTNALHVAANRGHIPVVEWLIEINMPVDARDIDGRTSLRVAATSNNESNLQIIDVLLRAGADINTQCNSGDTPLADAVSRRKDETAVFLINRGADVNLANEYGSTPLHHAAGSFSTYAPQIIRLLLENGARTDVINGAGRTPLDTAN
jgi:beta-lactamase regulating signal transducer with metallopeptidase domain/ankyrin repeat protein